MPLKQTAMSGLSGNINIAAEYNEPYIHLTCIEFKWPILLATPMRALGL